MMTTTDEANTTNIFDARTGKTSGMAIAAIIFSILIPLVGLILGIISLKKIKKSSGQITGKGLAIAALIISSVLLAIQCFILLPLHFFDNVEGARVATTKATLVILKQAVISFRLDTGRYPTEEEGLYALIEESSNIPGRAQGGYLAGNKIPKDSWNNDFEYQLNPNGTESFVIISYGADGIEGGKGYNTDIYSTDL